MKNNRIIFRIILALLWAGIGIFRTEGKNVLKGLDMTLDKNSIIGLLGLNGSGKTTLMNVICGLHDAYRSDKAKFYGKETAFRNNDFKKTIYRLFGRRFLRILHV